MTDGKTRRRRLDQVRNTSAIHRVSAWATANSISPGQVVDAHQNDFIQLAASSGFDLQSINSDPSLWNSGAAN
ncbi:MAG: hypothetical protein IID45_12310 [Planctomycetes bacterium]|nr:hypothetical protein [Planctomycetota bacterium]